MEIKDLQPKMGKVEIVVTVKDIQEPKEFDRFGKITRVANATAFDETGSIKMSIWNDDIDKIKEGSKILIKNGYVSEWQGEMQLGTGKFGTIEVAEEGSVKKKVVVEKPNKSKKVVEEEDFEEDVDEEDIEY